MREGPVADSAADLLALSDTDTDSRDAADVLLEILSDGPMWVKDAVDAMADAGFSKDQAKAGEGESGCPVGEGRQAWRPRVGLEVGAANKACPPPRERRKRGCTPTPFAPFGGHRCVRPLP